MTVENSSKDPGLLRACAEENHLWPIRSGFHLAPGATLPTSSSPQNETSTAPLLYGIPFSSLTPDLVRRHYNKDCVIYGLAPMNGVDHSYLFDFVYREWFPRRDRVADLAHGTFFTSLLNIIPPADIQPGVLKAINEYHTALGERLRALEGDVREIVYPTWHARWRVGQGEEAGLFRIKGTWEKVWIVIDRRDWRAEGVLIVCRDESKAETLGLLKKDDEVGFMATKRRTDLEVGGVVVVRMSLKEAMRAVVSEDEGRRGKKKEYNEIFEEWYGSSGEEGGQK
ncbi:hypothetical protein MMC24_007514 [Lignoscripta atroalba]|nr:hypothetical protein [Lignoscripta atroalba]